MIDKSGYRLNVGIIIINTKGQVLWCRRLNTENAWQFPQGGINDYETLEEAMFRELEEELGLGQDQVALVARTRRWVSYELPKNFRRYDSKPLCVGQKQKWFLLRLLCDDDQIDLNRAQTPEFDQWQWVPYWYPLEQVIPFKRAVYQAVLSEFEPYVSPESC